MSVKGKGDEALMAALYVSYTALQRIYGRSALWSRLYVRCFSYMTYIQSIYLMVSAGCPFVCMGYELRIYMCARDEEGDDAGTGT